MNIAAANWKMNLDGGQARAYLDACLEEDAQWRRVRDAGVKPMLFVPATHLAVCADHLPEGFVLGAQNIHHEVSGAYTGEVSLDMVASVGATAVLVGHSERRQHNGETDEDCAGKVRRVLEKGLFAMLCVGETLPEREAGGAEKVVAGQIRGALSGLDPKLVSPETFAVAYEPVWAIGTGKEAGAADAEAMSALILSELSALGLATVPVLYGGSVKPENAKRFAEQPHVSGALVGGAALDPAKFLAIAQAFG